jgi:hypothetical protein
MVNPILGPDQGYDGRASGYNASTTKTFPLVLNPGDSLISSYSRPESDGSRQDLYGGMVDLYYVKLIGASVLIFGSNPFAVRLPSVNPFFNFRSHSLI